MDFSDKRNELESKFKKEEQKKVDKQMRKDEREWDDLYNRDASQRTTAKGLKTLADAISKIIKDQVAKSLKKYNLATAQRE